MLVCSVIQADSSRVHSSNSDLNFQNSYFTQSFVTMENTEMQAGEVHPISKAHAAPPSLGSMLYTSRQITRHKIATGMKIFSECFMPQNQAYFTGEEKKKYVFLRGDLVHTDLEH